MVPAHRNQTHGPGLAHEHICVCITTSGVVSEKIFWQLPHEDGPGFSGALEKVAIPLERLVPHMMASHAFIQPGIIPESNRYPER